MIRLLLMDVESVLRAPRTVGPAVRPALEALSRLEVEGGARLRLAPVACDAAAAWAAGEVGALGLADLLPRDGALSLPLRGGAAERAAFAAAVERLLAGAGVEACAAVLRDEARVLQCRRLGLPALAPGFDGMDWRDLPLMVARFLDPAHLGNLAIALGPLLAPAVERPAVVRAEADRILARGEAWVQVPAGGAGFPEGLRLQLPVDVTVTFEPGMRVKTIAIGDPAPERLQEAAAKVERLLAEGAVALAPDRIDARTTHVIEAQADGPRLQPVGRQGC